MVLKKYTVAFGNAACICPMRSIRRNTWVHPIPDRRWTISEQRVTSLKFSLNSPRGSKRVREKERESPVGDKTRRVFPPKVRFIQHFAAPPLAFKRAASRPGVAPFIIPREPSALSDNSFLRSHFFLLLLLLLSRAVFSPPSSVIQSLSRHPSSPPLLPALLLYHRLSISRPTAVTFKRNLHNGVV